MPQPDQTNNPKKQIAMIHIAGGVVTGVSHPPRGSFIWFTDPQTGSTLAMYAADVVSVEAVQAHIARNREKFKPKVF